MVTDGHAVVDHAAHSAYSDPGDWAGLLDDIEPSVEAASAMARNVVVHYRGAGRELPEHSRDDISLRWVSAMLETDQRRHEAPLTTERRAEDRLQGCCRDHTLLAVAALRHHGVPARSRVGFASYITTTTWHHDHVIVEAWLDGRWRRFDPEFDSARPGLDDPADIPHGPDGGFLTAANVWLGHRAGALDVTQFGVAEDLDIGGDWFVYGYVIGEVAHRFGDELLLWDHWGAMSGDLARVPSEHLELVDEVARLLIRADDGDLAAERELLSRYRDDDRLHPGPIIWSASPYGGYYKVDVTTRTTERLD